MSEDYMYSRNGNISLKWDFKSMLLWKQNTCVNENDGCNNNETFSKALLRLKFCVKYVETANSNWGCF